MTTAYLSFVERRCYHYSFTTMKYTTTIILLLSFTALVAQESWTVIKVVDGDTFYAVREGTKKKFRLIGIDTPEFSHFGKPEEPYAQEATDFLSDMVLYHTVILSEDLQPLDKYKRSLVYVYMSDSTFVNAELVEKGWATTMTIPPNVEYSDHFRKLQSEARIKKIGIWQDPSAKE